MEISRALLKSFANITNDTPKEKAKPYTYGTVKVSEGSSMILLDGAEMYAPFVPTTDVKDGDRILVTVENHKITAVGNISDPSASGSVVARHSEQINQINSKFTQIGSNFEQVYSNFEQIESNFSQVNSDFTEVNSSIATLNSNVETINANISTIDSTVKTQESNISTLQSTVNTQGSNISTLQSTVNTQGSSIDTLNSTVSTHDSKINTASSDITILNSAFEIKDGHVTGLKSIDVDAAKIKFADIDEASIDLLMSKKAVIDNLEANYATIDMANVNNAWIQNGVLQKASVLDETVFDLTGDKATISQLDAGKIRSGELDASLVKVKNLNADNITTGSISVGGVKLNLTTNTAELDGGDIKDGTVTLSGLAEDVKREIDGAIETFTVDHVPTAFNTPESEWTTDALKDKHIGDIVFVVNEASENNGFSYRYTYDESTKLYKWVLIKDSQITKALGELEKATGDISGLKTFKTSASKWMEETETGIETHSQRLTTIETTYSTKAYTDGQIGDLKKAAITGVDVEYAQNSSPTTAPTEGWTTDAPAWESGKYMWQRTVTYYADGDPDITDPINISGANGKDGANGTSVTITEKKVEYKEGISPTTVPGEPWSETVPTVAEGKYLWTRTVVTYSDGNKTTAYSVARQGEDGENGTNGTSSYTHIRYSANSDGRNFTDSPRTDTVYIGVYTGTSATAPTTTGSYKWAKYIGDKGDKGDTGSAGNGINSITYYYKATQTQTQPNANEITGTSIPTLSNTNKYLWQKEVIDFTDQNVSDKTSVLLLAVYGDKGTDGKDGTNGTNGTNGKDGTSITIKSTSITYHASDSGTTKPSDNNWSLTVPSINNGQYLWTKTLVTYSDDTKTEAYSVAYKGTNGTNGKDGTNGTNGVNAYTHIRYSANSNGSNFTTSPSASTPYIGVYSGTSATAPTSASSYTWSKFIGDKGDKGDTGLTGNGINSITYYYKTTQTQTQPSANDITGTTIPTLSSTNKYLWQKEVIDFTDSSVADKTSVLLLAVYGDKGTDGTNGKDGTSITIKSTSITYHTSTSGTTKPADNNWLPKVPTVNNGEYLWTKTLVTYSDDTKTEAYSVAYKGTNGTNGTNGKDGVSPTVVSTITEYQQSTSGTTIPTGTWLNDPPTATAGQFMWTKVTSTYSDSKEAVSYTVSKNGTNGQKGDTGVGIASIEEQYAVGSSNTTAPTTGWDVKYTWNGTGYVWTRSKITYNDRADHIEYTTATVASGFNTALNVANSANATANTANNTANQASTNAATAVTNAQNAINAINSLTIGGRNLFLRTKDFDKGDEFWNSSPSNPTKTIDTDGFTYVFVQNTWSNYFYQNKSLTLNETYTVSLYAKADVNVTLEIKDDSTNNHKLGEISVNSTNWERYSITFKHTTGSATPKIAFLTRQASTPIYIKAIKLEKGNKATDWTPAPEDVDAKIDTKISSDTFQTYVNDVYELSKNITNITDRVDAIYVGNRNLYYVYDIAERTLTGCIVDTRGNGQMLITPTASTAYIGEPMSLNQLWTSKNGPLMKIDSKITSKVTISISNSKFTSNSYAWLDKDKKCISTSTFNSVKTVLTVPENAEYLTIRVGSTSLTSWTEKEELTVMVAEGEFSSIQWSVAPEDMRGAITTTRNIVETNFKTEVGKVSADVSGLEKKVNDNYSEITDKTSKLTVDLEGFRTDVTNNYQMKPTYAENSEEAYTKDVENATYAKVNMIGGKTIAWNQLSNNNAVTSTFNGITATWSNGSVVVNGTSTGRANFAVCSTANRPKLINGHKYLLRGCPQGGSWTTYRLNMSLYNNTTYINTPMDDFGSGVVYTLNNANANLGVIEVIAAQSSSQTVSNLVFKPQLYDLTLIFGAGNEPTAEEFRKMFPVDYYPYNSGELISASVNDVKSVGKNLWDEEWELGGYIWASGVYYDATDRIRNKYPIEVEPNTTYSVSKNIGGVLFYDSSMNHISTNQSFSYKFTTPLNARYVNFVDTYVTNYQNDFSIVKGDNGSYAAYTPYLEKHLPIPTNFPCYGYSAGNVYNYLDLKPVTYHNMKSVDLGTLNWENTTTNRWSSKSLANEIKIPADSNIQGNAITSNYSIRKQSGSFGIGEFAVMGDGSIYFASEKQPTGILYYEVTSGGEDYTAYLYHQRVGSHIFDGNENWNIANNGTTHQVLYWTVPDSSPSTVYGQAPVICNKYAKGSGGWNSDNNIQNITNTNSGATSAFGITFPYGTYTQATYKALIKSMYDSASPMIWQYELATERIYDATQYVINNIIEVEDGGTLTFCNTNGDNYRIPVPNSEQFMNVTKSELDTGLLDRVTMAQSSIIQNADNISMKVSKDGVISSINQSPESITINASKINLSGYVTVSALSGNGTTTIDGSNIKTGTISADRIDVGGLFAKDITATGTIRGVKIEGGTGSFTGTITATGGTIGGWTIKSNYLSNGNIDIVAPISKFGAEGAYFSTSGFRINAFSDNGQLEVRGSYLVALGQFGNGTSDYYNYSLNNLGWKLDRYANYDASNGFTNSVSTVQLSPTGRGTSDSVFNYSKYKNNDSNTILTNIHIDSSGEFHINSKENYRIGYFCLNSLSNVEVSLQIANDIKTHGIYSTGYYNGTSYTASGKWLVYRDSTGTIYLNGNANYASTSNYSNYSGYAAHNLTFAKTGYPSSTYYYNAVNVNDSSGNQTAGLQNIYFASTHRYIMMHIRSTTDALTYLLSGWNASNVSYIETNATTVAFGSSNIYGKSISISGASSFVGNVAAQGVYNQTWANAANVRILGSDNGYYLARATSSSRRYKHDIKSIEVSDYKRLLNIPVVTYKYNTDYLDSKDDRYLKDVPGFIAEEVEQYYPIAVDYEDGKVEDWNARFIIPPMLSLIQDSHKRLDDVNTKLTQANAKIEQLETMLLEAFNQIGELQKEL